MERLAVRLVILAVIARALEINTSTSKILEKAEGENVKLACFFTPGPEDAGNLEIEWSVKSIRHPLEKAEILWYTAGHIYDSLYEHLKGRVYFDSEDPAKGDAAINLSLLTTKDTGIYYCQVKKVPGIKSIYTVLRVLKPPSKPRCSYTERGQTKVLRCESQEGAAPINYHWSRYPPWEMMPNSAVMDKAAGTLTVPDATERDQGTYKCTAMNRVGKKVCLLDLNQPRPPSVAKIAGAVAAHGLLPHFGQCVLPHCGQSVVFQGRGRLYSFYSDEDGKYTPTVLLICLRHLLLSCLLVFHPLHAASTIKAVRAVLPQLCEA